MNLQRMKDKNRSIEEMDRLAASLRLQAARIDFEAAYRRAQPLLKDGIIGRLEMNMERPEYEEIDP